VFTEIEPPADDNVKIESAANNVEVFIREYVIAGQ
jgi:hypothetical protein